MTLQIYKLTLGPLQTNCYLLGDTISGDAVVIDPVDNAPVIHKTAQDAGWTIREILATHGHFDHIMASADLKALTGAPFRVPERDLSEVRRMAEIVQAWIGISVPPAPEPDGLVKEGDAITVGGIVLDVLFTPGHTPGHVSYVLASEKIVFCGDVLFHNSIGRTDLPGGDPALLLQSIRDKLLSLGDDYTVAPGHMEMTTIGYERQHNPFLLPAR